MKKKPANDRQPFIEELEELQREFSELEARVDRLLEPHLKELAGPHLETMLKSPEETIKFLSNPSPSLREAALQIANRNWKITDQLATVYENMALSDPNDGVRDAAIRALGTCFRKTKNARIGKLLAKVVRNDSLDESRRLTAFTSLLRLHGNMDYVGVSPLVPRSLCEVDWDFVDTYLGRTSNSQP